MTLVGIDSLRNYSSMLELEAMVIYLSCQGFKYLPKTKFEKNDIVYHSFSQTIGIM